MGLVLTLSTHLLVLLMTMHHVTAVPIGISRDSSL